MAVRNRSIVALVMGLVLVLLAPVGVATADITQSRIAATRSTDQLLQQLDTAGYKLNGQSGSWSPDARRMIVFQIFEKEGEPTITIVDTAAGIFRIDNVSYGKTGKYGEFWCSATYSTMLKWALRDTAVLREKILNGDAKVKFLQDPYAKRFYHGGSGLAECHGKTAKA